MVSLVFYHKCWLLFVRPNYIPRDYAQVAFGHVFEFCCVEEFIAI